MNAVTRSSQQRLARPVAVQDPPHLHLAAAAMAYTVRSGALSYTEAASSLALAAIDEGALDRLDDAAFQALCGRLEHTMIQATIRIDHRAADAIRRSIARAIADRRPRQVILAVARLENLLGPRGLATPGHRGLPTLDDRVVYEICRQEVSKAVAASRSRIGSVR